MVELDGAQVDRVVRAAAEGGSMSVLLTGLGGFTGALSRELSSGWSALMDDSRLSRSLLLGLLVLASLPADGSYMGIADIARSTGMNSSTTHRYVTTLVAVGLVERDPSSRKYRLVGDLGGARGA